MQKISYAGYRFPPEIIERAIWLYLRFTLSFRDVDLLAERGIMVSYETVRRWVDGIVRVKSVATREAVQFSAIACLRRERSPLGQRHRAPLFVVRTAEEMTFQIEVIVDLAVNRHELLQRGPTPKSLHRMLAPPKRLM